MPEAQLRHAFYDPERSSKYPNDRFRVFGQSEGTEVLLLVKSQKLDEGILVAVDRYATGATAHNLRGLANAYVLACESGQPRRAEEYRIRLFSELVRACRSANARKS